MPFSSAMILKWLHFWDVAAALMGLFIFSCLHHKLTNKNAPMLWPVLGIIPSLFLNANTIYDWATMTLIKAEGTFSYRGVWFGGSYGIITVDPSNIEYMLKTRFSNFPKGKYYRERFHDLLGDGIFNADNDAWKEQRRLATSEMHSGRFMEHSYNSMQELVHKMLKLMEKVASSGSSIDLQEVLLRFIFDNICSAALGVDSGCLNLDLPQIPFVKAFEEATELTMFRFMVPPFVWKPMRLLGIGFEKRLKEAMTMVHSFTDKTVKDQREELMKLGSLVDRSDLLSRLMDRDKHHFSDKFLSDFCISFILAGRDTSSVGMAWLFWLVQKYPEVENKILKEISEILGQRKCSGKELSDGDAIFTVEELKKMVYLQAVFSESLRLYPPVPMDIKEVVQDDVFPDGNIVKKGARVLYCIYSMARMESIWGHDCLDFKPERWINNDGELLSENPFKYTVFNGGPRFCLGKKFAYTQMKMIAATTLLRYEVKVVEGQNVIPKMTTTLYMQNGLLVILKPRRVTNIV